MSINIGDRLKFDRGPFSDRKALVTSIDYAGFYVEFEDHAGPVAFRISYERDWTAPLSFYRGVTVYAEFPPIPLRQFDYRAVYEGDEENADRHGWGATKEEALEDLGGKLRDRVDDRLYDMKTAGEWDAETMEEAFVSIGGLSYLPY